MATLPEAAVDAGEFNAGPLDLSKVSKAEAVGWNRLGLGILVSPKRDVKCPTVFPGC